MNKTQKNIIKDFNIGTDSFLYFTKEVENKIKNLGLPNPFCSIVKIFKNTNEEMYHKRAYCLQNCYLKCLRKKRTNK